MNNKNDNVPKYIQGMQKHTRKQQLRDARRKSRPRNQEQKPRFKKFSTTGWDDWEELDEMAFDSYEPILSQSERERRKEIEKAVQRGTVGITSEIPDAKITGSMPDDKSGISALVVESSSGMCRVEHNGEIIICSVRGSLKNQETGYTNVVAVGDQVLISRNGDDQGVVEAVLPRRSVLSRPYAPDQGVITDLQQIVVANVDRLLIVASWREPYIWPALIDRYLITAQRNHLTAVICINKIDLIEDPVEFEITIAPYQALGYRLVKTSATSGEGIEELGDLLSTGTSVLAGLSGVGKSSLLTAVQPDLDLKVSKVSQQGLFTGQGRHTTTQSSLWKLERGGIVIDTPGVRTFGVAGILPSQLANLYPEMAKLIGKCRFGDCLHINEPECAIQAAVKDGSISELRYKNYTQIIEELN